ncbi:MAG TPA: S-layer homology domain-containing protein [Clostridiales bacterium]|nr:S-layer homology domain-containing protein [Clostridiales bacterium]
MKAISTSSNAIFSNATLSIKNGAEIDATGYYSALYGKSAISIENSEIEAVSTNDIGIFSRGLISIAGGTVHAKGSTNFAAIAARVVKSGEEAATSKISLGVMIEKNNGKTAVSDWFLHSVSGETRSWTSFIAAGDSALNVDDNGRMTNALNEVSLTAFIPVTEISGGPVTVAAGTNLTLTGNVEPTNATNQTILWNVKDAGTTGAVINDNVLVTTAAGTVTVTAKIVNGASPTSDYTQNFNITVTEWENPFNDVKKDDWFYDNIANMVNRGLFKGVSGDRFDPNEKMSRAMFVTVLARLDGADLSSYQGASHFADVKQGTWYAPAVNWAYDKGVVSGISDQEFSPNLGISRQEMAKMIMIYADYAGITLPTDQGSGKAFIDLDKVAPWAKTYVEAAEKAGLLRGYNDGSFRPQNTSTRAEAATVFTRFEALK